MLRTGDGGRFREARACDGENEPASLIRSSRNEICHSLTTSEVATYLIAEAVSLATVAREVGWYVRRVGAGVEETGDKLELSIIITMRWRRVRLQCP